ncbi:phosphatidylserine decarboxylase [Deinococcus aerophilus]|uniref:Phosphatidylserine decarboxylase n=1 Tax=Deinococcus aerophilus TaxID=522488 RepID=A0ABQ2GI63_9DEIO|nr:phosphatidylserine decarboxylase [Deinococcus aerophilus]GGL96612.1 hypothetical protein GCM10010841_01250 [Deinococcus aerophilus]
MRLRRVLPLLALASAALYLRNVYRFRDPVRVPPAGAAVLSPADGVVSFVRRIENGQVEIEALNTQVAARDLLGTGPGADAAQDDGWLVGIFVGPLDVHYTYQPVDGEVAQVQHRGSRSNVALLGPAQALTLLAGRPADVLGTRGLLENERLSMVTDSALGSVGVTLVAPGAGLQATSYLRQGDGGRAGHKSAFLAEGGVVLLHLPAALTPQVSVGERVLGAQTVVARS